MKIKILLLGILFATSVYADFSPNMTFSESKIEVKTQLSNKIPPHIIVASAKSIKLDVVQILLDEGVDISLLFAPTSGGNSNTDFASSRASSVGGGGRVSVSKN